MVSENIDLDEHIKFILEFIKNKYDMNNISEAITFLALDYEDTEEEIPDTREYDPDFVKEILNSKYEPHYGLFKNTNEMEEFMEHMPDEEEFRIHFVLCFSVDVDNKI